MRLLRSIAIGLTNGILIGYALGLWRRHKYKSTGKPVSKLNYQLTAAAATFLKYATFLLLAVGLIWCGYFLGIALIDPSQTSYASEMAQLIVSFLTVISILFAFFEFIRRK